MTAVSVLKSEVVRLRSVLTHDCSGCADECHCFNRADIDAYEDARQRLADLELGVA